MTTLEKLNQEIASAKSALTDAEAALAEYESRPENNVYASLDDAQELEEVLEGMAFADCQGAHNCGAAEYKRGFMVDDREYVASLKCEYNRHDKTYYYLEESFFSIAPKTSD